MHLFFYLFLLGVFATNLLAQNQTETITPVKPSALLPFQISVETADFSLPVGLQTFVFATYQNKCLLLAGRTNGLHDFSNTNDNFPPKKQNTTVYVVDFQNEITYERSLFDETANLTQKQIDVLSVTAAEFVQVKDTLYMVGGYGVDTLSGEFSTKSTLTVIDVPGLISWVEGSGGTAAENMKQTSHPILKVTGGALKKTNPLSPFLLIFGQNFQGFYHDSSNGVYTEEVRPFYLLETEKDLFVVPLRTQGKKNTYRRRDLNVISITQKQGKTYEEAYVALSGVFTLSGGIWTVPVLIDGKGRSRMLNPAKPETLRQGMNNYDCPHIGLFAKKTNEMHTLLLGGMGYIALENGTFVEDSEIPFSNSITDICIDRKGNFKQYLMESEYPVILSTLVNPGNPLLFGAGARFIQMSNLPIFPNGVISLDDVKDGAILGYVIGGIQSTVPNTTSFSDSEASAYIFRVQIEKR